MIVVPIIKRPRLSRMILHLLSAPMKINAFMQTLTNFVSIWPRCSVLESLVTSARTMVLAEDQQVNALLQGCVHLAITSVKTTHVSKEMLNKLSVAVCPVATSMAFSI